MAQAVSRRLLPQKLGFEPRSVHVRFVVENVALDRFFSYCIYSLSVSFHYSHAQHNDVSVND